VSRVVHFEIHAGDCQRAIAFYTALFGWEFTKWDSGMEYWVIKTGPSSEPGIDGGLLPRRGEIDGQAVIAYVCTIEVKSVDESLVKIASLGGKVVAPKMALPAVGWLAYARDTEGNTFGVMQPDPTAK